MTTPSRAGQSRWRRNATWIMAVVIVALAHVALGIYAYGETLRLEVKEYTFTSSDVPAAFDGTRIVFITDVHRSFYWPQERVGEMVDRANALGADLILLGGDYVFGSKDYEASAFAELGRLEAPLGVFAVLGNHDYAHPGGDVNDPAPTLAAAEAVGIPVLNDTGIWIEESGERMRLAGVSDAQEGRPDPVSAAGGAVPSDMVLLLSHNPDIAESLQPGHVDLVLSGHTHGGQITFFGLWAPRSSSEYGQKYRTGMVVTETTTVIVSNGIGVIFPPLRFFADPQIVVVTLDRPE